MALDMESYAKLFLLWLLTFLLLGSFFKRYVNYRTARLPPSPLALPILGHLYLLGPLIHRSLHHLSKRYGPLIHLRLGTLGSVIVVSSPKMAREFLKAHDLNFASRPHLVAQDYVPNACTGFAFAPYSPYWKFMKKLCVSELFSSKKLDQSMKIRQEEIRSLLGHFFEKSRYGEQVDIKGTLTALTNNIICRMVMSMRCSGSENDADECRKLVEEVVEMGGRLNFVHILHSWRYLDLFGYGKRLNVAYERFMDIMEKILKEHEEKKMKKEMDGVDGIDEDLMDTVIKITQDETAELKLSRGSLKAFFLDLFIGGTETSSTTMQWALSELIRHPDVLKKAREEIESIVGKDRLVEESDIPNLHYIQAIVKETLRLHPTVPLILRESIQDCNIEGFSIPHKTKIFINVWAIGRDPEYWKSPLEFQPERFLNSNMVSSQSAIDLKGQNFELIPFGSGRRICPGISLALHVIHATIAALVQCFDWQYDGSMGQSKIDMKESVGLTLRMDGPLYYIPTTHRNPLATST
ncbi:cytochrome P450 93A3-like [Magnolia sinica]|uniref:cytochrome P450 93A3-like n=1 Tax=Magnolia sinica TaxID=86752 RepID=UPI00265AF476|nr:cytochrome P450 93A3-like [Magnolia sinica]